MSVMGFTLLSYMLGSGFGFPSSTPNLPSIDNLNEMLGKANKDE